MIRKTQTKHSEKVLSQYTELVLILEVNYLYFLELITIKNK